jgi:hypothetical protein
MSHPEPGTRVISPHALAHDGFRWHVRAFCHSRSEFRDFVLGRILDVLGCENVRKPSTEDVEWNTILTLVLAPHPGLSEGKRRIIELDYGMQDGTVELSCRQALLFYALKKLGLSRHDGRPEAQQIVLKNQTELSAFLS